MFDNLFIQKGLTLDRLRHFCEVADAGSIAGAVERHGRNQSSYSRDIQQLESFFGEPLFLQREGKSRSGKRFEGLTPRGEALRLQVLDFFESLTRLLDFRGELEVIRIGGGETLLHWIAYGYLEAIREEFPGLSIRLERLDSAAIIRGVEQGQLEVGLVDAPALSGVSDDIQAWNLGQIDYALYLSRDLVDAARGYSERRLLEKWPLTGLDDSGFSSAMRLGSSRTDGFALSFAVLLTSYPQMFSTLKGRRMAGVLPKHARDEMKPMGFEMLRHPFLKQLAVPISLIWNQRLAELSPVIGEAASKVQAVLTRQA